MNVQLILAIGTISVLIVNFGLDQLFRYRYRTTLQQEPPADSTRSARDLAALTRRNKRLGWLGAIVFVLLIALQSFNIANAVNNKNEQKMKDLEERVKKIETYLWGGGGGSALTPPSDPSGGPAVGKSIDAKIAQINLEVEALQKNLQEIMIRMQVAIPA